MSARFERLLSADRTALRAYIEARVETSNTDACWVWPLCKNPKGRGIGSLKNHVEFAYRMSFQGWVGGIHEDLEIDHLCNDPACVNPWHLEQKTGRENLFRGNAITVANAKKVFCKYGHNDWTHLKGKNTGRKCKTCNRLRMRETNKKIRKAAAKRALLGEEG